MGDRSHGYSHGYRGGRDRDRERSRHSSSSSYGYDHGHGHGRDHHHSYHERGRGRPQQSSSYRSRQNHTSGGWRHNETNSVDYHNRQRDRPRDRSNTSGGRRSPPRERETQHQHDRSSQQWNAQFSRRDDAQEFSRRTGIEPEVLSLMERLREYIPYLNKRMREIHNDGRERELEDEVTEINWIMDVITDVNADENVGVQTMLAAHERMVEMVRQHPIKTVLNLDRTSDEESLLDEGDEAPRSPSPPQARPLLEASTSLNPRVIPMERSSFMADWAYRPPETRVFEYDHGQDNNKPSLGSSFEEWERDSPEERSPEINVHEPPHDWAAKYRRPPPASPAQPPPPVRPAPPPPQRLERPSRDMDMRFSDPQSMEWDAHKHVSNFGQRDRDMRISDGNGSGSSIRSYDTHLTQTTSTVTSLTSPAMTGITSTIQSGLAGRNTTMTGLNPGGLSETISPRSINLMNPGVSIGSSGMNSMNGVPMSALNQMNPLMTGMNPNIPSGMAYGSPFMPNGMLPGQGLLGQAPGFPGHAGSAYPSFNPSATLNSAPGLLPLQTGMPNQNQTHTPNITAMSNVNAASFHQQQQQQLGASHHRMVNAQGLQSQNFTPRIPNVQPMFPTAQSSTDHLPGNRYNSQEESLMSQIKEKATLHFAATNAAHNRAITIPQESRSSHNQVPAPTTNSHPMESSVTGNSPLERPALASNQILADPRLKGRFAKEVYNNQAHKHQTLQPQPSPVAVNRPPPVPDNAYTSTSKSISLPTNTTPSVSGKNTERPISIASRNTHISNPVRTPNPAASVIHSQDNNNLKAIRERVRSKTVMTTPKPQMSKLQELRQSIQLHPLGQKGIQKKRVSFEDALAQPPIETITPEKRSPAKTNRSDHRRPQKTDLPYRPGVKNQRSKDVIESQNRNDNQGVIGKRRPRLSEIESASKSASEPKKARMSPRKVNNNSTKTPPDRSRRLSNSSETDGKQKAATKVSHEDPDPMRRPSTSFGFRIPKIKRPEPPPPPPPPEIPLEEEKESESESLDTSFASELDNEHVPPSTSNQEVSQPQSNEGARVNPPEPVETDSLIRDLILRSVSPGEAERITSDTNYMTDLISRLKTELTSKLKERPNELSTPTTNEQAAGKDSTSKADPAGVDSQETILSPTSPPSPPTGSRTRGRPRTVTRKKGTKRRSSLEKLHDALREMNFDTMLPLGPRRGASRSQHEETPPGPVQLIHQILDKDNQDGPKKESAEESEVVSPVQSVVPAKRGRKRKRKAIVTCRSKKKGRKTTVPVSTEKTRAVVKTKKITKKPAIKVDKRKKKVSKVVLSRPSMVTRSRITRIGPRDIIVNRALNKVKMESDYIQPKREAEDDSAMNDNLIIDETEHLEEGDSVPNSVADTDERKETDFTHDMGIEACDLDNVNSIFDLKIEELDIPIDDDYEGKEILDEFDANKELLDAFDANKDVLDGLVGNKELMEAFDEMAKVGNDYKEEERNEEIEKMLDKRILEFGKDPRDEELQTKASTLLPPPPPPLIAHCIPQTPHLDNIYVDSVTVNPPEAVDNENETNTQCDTVQLPRTKGKGKTKGKRTRPLGPDEFECHLCEFTGKRIIHHYTNKHPNKTNPYTCLSLSTYSGLSQVNSSPSPQLMEVQFLRLNEELAWPCLFCESKFGTVDEYYEHTTVHTGEYRYSCPVCDIRNPFAKNIHNHFKSAHKTLDPSLHIIPTNVYETVFPPSGKDLYAYLCRECLYFQLQFANMSHHLQEERHSVEEVICIKFVGPAVPDCVPTAKFDESVFLGTKNVVLEQYFIDPPVTAALPPEVQRQRAISEAGITKLYNSFVKLEGTRIDGKDTETLEAETNEQIRESIENTVEWLLASVEFREESDPQNVKFQSGDGFLSLKGSEPGPSPQSVELEAGPSDSRTSKLPSIPICKGVDVDQFLEVPIQNIVTIESDEEEINDFYSDVSSEYSELDEDVESNEDGVVGGNSYNRSEHGSRRTSVSLENSSDFQDIIMADRSIEIIHLGMDYEPGSENENKNHPINLKGQELYRCGNVPCKFTGENSFAFKHHIYNCRFLEDVRQLPCFHCDKLSKSIPALLEHNKVHGRQRQVCGLCSHRSWLSTELAKHMKIAHKTNSYKIIKIATDDEPDSFMYPKEVASKLAQPDTLKQNHMLYSPKAQFYPHERENIPRSCIFTRMVYCALCSYSTKVRSNILRHLELHERADTDGGVTVVPCGAPINPVPWLERKELMFDKMTNWAGSSHMNKDGNGVPREDASKLPLFVLDQFRYVCSVYNCKQITVDDSLLRAHMKTLHSEVDFYDCPHCQDNVNTRDDIRNSVLIDKLGGHLKLHGPRLLKCGNCDYIHTQTRLMEKHISEKHPEKKPIHYLIRNLDNDGNTTNRRTSVDESQKANNDRWRCGICRALFTSWDDARTHCQQFHKVDGQFMCTSCNFTEDNIFKISSHVKAHEKKSSTAVMIMFFKNELGNSQETKQDEVANHSIWRRDDDRVRHIRGIYLEEPKEPKPSAPPRPPASTSTTPTKAAKPRERDVLRIEPPITKLVCPECNMFKTEVPSEMTIHLYNELRYQRYSCKVCKVPFVTLDSLMAHVMNDHKEAYDELIYLGLEPVNEDIEKFVRDIVDGQAKNVEAAVALSKAGASGGEQELECKHCSARFTMYHNLRTHTLAKHIAADRFKCKYCPVGFWSEGVLKQHHGKTHPEKPFEVVLDEEFEAKLTPDFWLKEYGIPLDAAKAFSPAKRLCTSLNPAGSFKPRQRRSNSDSGTDKVEKTKEVRDRPGKKTNVYKCSHCDKKCFTTRGIRSHWFKTHKEFNLTCRYVEFKAVNHCMEISDGISISCGYCMYTAGTLMNMKSHHSWKHAGLPLKMKRKQIPENVPKSNKLASPPETDRILRPKTLVTITHDSRIGRANNSDMNNRSDSKLIEDKISYECPLCATEFESEIEYEKHIHHRHHDDQVEPTLKYVRRVVSTKTFKDKMDKSEGQDLETATRKDQLNVINTHSLYCCPLCDYSTTIKEELTKIHLKIHVQTFKCPNCFKKFKDQLIAAHHVRLAHADGFGEPYHVIDSLAELSLQNRIIVRTAVTPRPPMKTKPKPNSKFADPLNVEIPVIDIVDDDEDVVVISPPRVYSKSSNKRRQTARKSTGKSPNNNVIIYERDDEVEDERNDAPKFNDTPAIFSKRYSIEYDDGSDVDETYEDPSTYVPGPSPSNPSAIF